MTLRPEFSLGNSEYNEFLRSSTGTEEHGIPVTVLSVLTRAGLDPWREAARLAALPHDTAAASLATVLSAQHHTNGASGETAMTLDVDEYRATALRLVSRLSKRASSGAVADPARGGPESSRFMITLVLVLSSVVLIGMFAG